MEMEVVVETSAGVMVPEKRWKNQPTPPVKCAIQHVRNIHDKLNSDWHYMGNLILSTIAQVFELLT